MAAGIHRNLGTHISKVRSVTLDKWSKEQVDVFRELGNKRVNRYYEARIPEDYRHPSPSDDAGMEKFIRDKYEKKRWVSKVRIGAPMSLAYSHTHTSLPQTSNDRSPRREKERGRREEGDAPEDADVPRQSPPPQPQPTAALLFDMGGAPAVAQSQAVPMAGFQPVVSQSQAQSPQFPAFFGAAAPAPGSVAQHAPPQQQQQQPSLSKDALLSLYAPQPMAPSNQPTMGGGAHTGFHGHPNYNVHLMNQQAPMQQPQWGQQQQWGQQPQQPQYYAQQPMAQQGYYVAQQPQQLWK